SALILTRVSCGAGGCSSGGSGVFRPTTIAIIQMALSTQGCLLPGTFDHAIHDAHGDAIAIRCYAEIECRLGVFRSAALRPLRQFPAAALPGSIAASRAVLTSSIRPSLTMHR